MYAPKAAPGRLVIPPSTAPAKPFSIGSSIMLGSSVAIGAISMPATAPVAELSPHVNVRMRLVGMPIALAAKAFCCTAFMAVPIFVYLKNANRRMVMARLASIVHKLTSVIRNGPKEKPLYSEKGTGNGFWLAPHFHPAKPYRIISAPRVITMEPNIPGLSAGLRNDSSSRAPRKKAKTSVSPAETQNPAP